MKTSEAHSELWHYTTAEGLLGILQSKQLWATRIEFLNDSEEFVGFFDSVLPGIVASIPDIDHHALSSALRDVLLGGFRTFTSSFSAIDAGDTDKDWLTENGRLSQWRGYGAGGGYALVFDTAKLEECLLQESLLFTDTQLSLFDAEYGMHSPESICHDENKSRLSALMEELPKLLMKIQTNADIDDSAHKLFVEYLLPLATARKNRAFREEREVRLAVTFPDPIRHSTAERIDAHRRPAVHHACRRGNTVPYVRLFEAQGLASLPVKRIVIGPHREKIGRQVAVESLLHASGFSSTDVVVSKIPYVE